MNEKRNFQLTIFMVVLFLIYVALSIAHTRMDSTGVHVEYPWALLAFPIQLQGWFMLVHSRAERGKWLGLIILLIGSIFMYYAKGN